jgi:hypothetical protein
VCEVGEAGFGKGLGLTKFVSVQHSQPVCKTKACLPILATKFGEHPENLATESLNYILGSSDVAKKALIQMLEQTGVRFKGLFSFQTQVGGEDNASRIAKGV